MVDADTKNVLVTAASGFLGSRLVAALRKRGYVVYGLDASSPSSPSEKDMPKHWIDCDLANEEDVKHAISVLRAQIDGNLSSVIHLAAHIIGSTRRLLQGLQSFQVEQFIFASSMSVMRPVEACGQVIDEESRAEAAGPVQRALLVGEQTTQISRGHIPAVILRIASVYDQMCHSLPIAQQIAKIYEQGKGSHLSADDERHGQRVVHLTDLLNCFLRTIESRKTLGPYEVFLIAEPEVVTYQELQAMIGLKIFGRSWTEEAPSITDQFPINIAKAQSKLGWTNQRRLRTELSRIIDELLANPKHWYHQNQMAFAASVKGRKNSMFQNGTSAS